MNDVAVINESGLVRLDEFLGAEQRPQACMVLDELDGFLTALACGPDSVPESEWLPEVWGDEGAGFASAAEEQEIANLIRGLLRSVEEELREGDTFEPMWYETVDEAGNDIVEPEGWCAGFMRGTQLREAQWEALFESEREHMLVAPILALALYQLPESEDDPMLARLGQDEALRREFMEAIPGAVKQIQIYWEQHRTH